MHLFNLSEIAGNQNSAQMQRYLLFTVLVFFVHISYTQTCSNPGQTPQTAFPVCGTTTFTQNSVPLCSGRNIPGPCGTTGLTDRNPYWYKFTCFSTGTLGFLISPLAANEDYDWQLFNVTGITNLSQVYTDPFLFVTCSWSGSFGNTGATAAGTANYACDGNTPLFTRMPTLIAGNEYLLMVSHWTSGQSGYNLTFNGGTAGITDTVTSHITHATAACDGVHINLKLNKKMRCNSLAANGSDFSISTAASNIIGATGFGCSGGFDLDSVQLTLNNPLPAGTYRLKAKLGSDTNTLLDVCGTPLAVGDSIDLVVPAQVPIPMDSVRVPTVCSPQQVVLEFSGDIRCNTVALNGSDFTVTGPTPVAVTGATGICNASGLTRTITVSLANPILVGGTYTIHLQTGADGNTLLNDCNQATPTGSSLSFVVRNAVSASFTSSVVYNPCGATDTAKFSHPGGNGINSWAWTTPGGIPVLPSGQNATITYNSPGVYNVTLIVFNGFCRDTSTQTFTINPITRDTVSPKLLTAVAPCEGSQVFVKLNKKIRCSSIASNGSDFRLRPVLAPVLSATGLNCNAAGETDSLLLTLGNILPTGTYTLLIGNGNDGNTITDNCNRSIPVGDSINNIAVVSHPLITFDSIGKVGCKPNELILLFKEPVRCSSIAANGSDFSISGPASVTITQAQATANCNNGFTNSIKLTLNSVITMGGNYIVTLKNGSDGNTLLNECNVAALANQNLSFIAGDTVSAAFTHSVTHACQPQDTIACFHNGQNGVTQWNWSFDNGTRSALQNPVVIYRSYGTKMVSLTVTNGICTDSTTQPVFIASDTLHASFEAPAFLCPSESVNIVNRSSGNIANYFWDFGDGFTTTTRTPTTHTYPIPLTQKEYNIKLTITGSLGCSMDTTVKVKALNNCLVAVPTAFTPNGDGLNDYLYPTNAFKADKLSFKVFNRFGQLVFEGRNMNQKWDGKMKGTPQNAGAYVWFLNYIDTDTGKAVSQKGTTVLIR